VDSHGPRSAGTLIRRRVGVTGHLHLRLLDEAKPHDYQLPLVREAAGVLEGLARRVARRARPSH
jgi:hypothetical protein